MKTKAQLEHAETALKKVREALELLTIAGYPHDSGIRPALRESVRALERDVCLASPSVQYRERLRAFVESHGFRATINEAGAVYFSIPWTKPATGEAGQERHEVLTLEQARAALGY